MEWVILLVLISILIFFNSTEEFLLSSGEILNDSKTSGSEDDFVVILAEVKSILVSITRKTVDMLNFKGLIRLGWVTLDIRVCLLIDLLKEELLSLLLL